MSACPHEHIADCPLYVLSHDPAWAGYGCVDDLGEPCRVERGAIEYDAAIDRASAEAFNRARQRLGVSERPGDA